MLRSDATEDRASTLISGEAQRGALIGITVPVAAHTNSGQPSPPHTSREHAVVVVSIVTGAATSGIVTVVMAAIIGTSGTVVPLPRLPGPVAAAASLIRPPSSSSASSSTRPVVPAPATNDTDTMSHPGRMSGEHYRRLRCNQHPLAAARLVHLYG